MKVATNLSASALLIQARILNTEDNSVVARISYAERVDT